MSGYSLRKTIEKGAVPVVVLVVVKVILEIAKSQGVVVDEGTALTVAMSGYGAVIGFINWIKNRKKGK